MGTTTFEAVRNSQFTAIEGITPSSLDSAKFVKHHAEQDFRTWCEENPQACFRRVSIADLFDYEGPQISNTDVEFVEGRQEIVVAYPTDYRYGLDAMRDMRDIIREDRNDLDNALGHRGTGNYTDAHAVLDSEMVEEAEGVRFLTLGYVFRFNRSV